MNASAGRGTRSTVAKPASTASASERRSPSSGRRHGGNPQRTGDPTATGPDALQLVPLPIRRRDRRPAAIAATVVFGGDLVALGAALLLIRPAAGANAVYALLAMAALLA